MANNTGLRAWFKSLQSVPGKWRRRTGAERRLLMEAFLLLGIARLALLVLPFKCLAITLGRHMKETGTEMDSSDIVLRPNDRAGRLCSRKLHTLEERLPAPGRGCPMDAEASPYYRYAVSGSS